MSRCRWCKKKPQFAGLCSTHYSRSYRHPLGEDEFWTYVVKTPTCWNWYGVTRRGFARVMIMDYKTGEVKRHWAGMWIYEKTYGSIGDMGLFLTCRNRSCVNPEHMTKFRRLARATVSRMR